MLKSSQKSTKKPLKALDKLMSLLSILKNTFQATFEATGNGAILLFIGVLWLNLIDPTEDLEKSASKISAIAWMVSCILFKWTDFFLGDEVKKDLNNISECCFKSTKVNTIKDCTAVTTSLTKFITSTIWQTFGTYNIFVIAEFVFDQIFSDADIGCWQGENCFNDTSDFHYYLQWGFIGTGILAAAIDLPDHVTNNLIQHNNKMIEGKRNDKTCCDSANNITTIRKRLNKFIMFKDYVKFATLGVVDMAAILFLAAFGKDGILKPSGFNNPTMYALGSTTLLMSMLRVLQKASIDIEQHYLNVVKDFTAIKDNPGDLSTNKPLDYQDKTLAVIASGTNKSLDIFFSAITQFNYPTVTYLVLNTTFKLFGANQRFMEILFCAGFGGISATIEAGSKIYTNYNDFRKNINLFFGNKNIEPDEANKEENEVIIEFEDELEKKHLFD